MCYWIIALVVCSYNSFSMTVIDHIHITLFVFLSQHQVVIVRELGIGQCDYEQRVFPTGNTCVCTEATVFLCVYAQTHY